MKKTTFFALSVILLLLIITGCSAKKDITIAAFLSLSGDLASFGKSAQAGCEIAEKDI
jgi:ABC-type branched-subunit amino acid transport system substrate-binding protein